MKGNQYIPLGIGLRTLIVDRFEIFEKRGSTPVSAAFGVLDHRNANNELCLDLYSPAVTPDSLSIERLFKEVELVKKLEHPGIVKVLDIGKTSEDHCYIISEYLDVLSLEQILEHHTQKGTAFEQIAYCLMEIARGLAYAHKNRLLHRDLNPTNILLLSNGELKIKNFGVSSLWYREEFFAKSEGFLGNPFYCAPEEVAGNPLDERVDIYALGVIGYELLTGEVPYQGRNAAEVLDRTANEAFPELPLNSSVIPSWLAELVNVATKRHPAERFQSIDEMLDILERHLDDDSRRQDQIALAMLVSTLRNEVPQILSSKEKYLCPICKARLLDVEKALIPKFVARGREFRCWKCGSALYWWKPAYTKINIGLLSLLVGFGTVVSVIFGGAVAWGISAWILGLIGLFQGIAGAMIWADGMQSISIVRE